MNDQENADNMIYYHTWVSKGARMKRMRLEKAREDELSLVVDVMSVVPTDDEDHNLVSTFQKVDDDDLAATFQNLNISTALRTPNAPRALTWDTTTKTKAPGALTRATTTKTKAVKTTCPPKRRLDEYGNCPAGMEQRLNNQGHPCCYVKKSKSPARPKTASGVTKTTCPPKRRLDEYGNCPAGMEQRLNNQGHPCCYVTKSKRPARPKTASGVSKSKSPTRPLKKIKNEMFI
jgi:hypothetical protein